MKGAASLKAILLYWFSFPVVVTASIPDPFTNSLGLATAPLLWPVMVTAPYPCFPMSTHSENVTLLLSARTLTNTILIQTQTILTQYKHKQTHSQTGGETLQQNTSKPNNAYLTRWWDYEQFWFYSPYRFSVLFNFIQSIYDTFWKWNNDRHYALTNLTYDQCQLFSKSFSDHIPSKLTSL